MSRQNFPKILVLIVFFFALTGVLTTFTAAYSTVNLNYNELVTAVDGNKVSNVLIKPANGMYSINGMIKKIVNEKEVEVPFNSNVPAGEVFDGINNKLTEHQVTIKYKEQEIPIDWFDVIFTIVIFISIITLIMRMGKKGGPLSAGDNKAKLCVKSDKLFKDVIGYEEEKQELVEIIDFLKDPKKYKEMGANIPNGLLLEGPPGTGKTLMAKAVAGEANVPFYSISGSDFIEMFVGVGASRVRNLFKEAKKNGPAIVFIDEIDAIGSRDNGGPGGRNTEQEQTINALLVELDGFSSFDKSKQVIIIGATNRVDKLDKALLRPGRFDRKIMMGLPEIKSREEILRYHASKRKMDSNVDYKSLARSTSGMSGAQLEAIINEGAILAVRENVHLINQDLLNEAVDRVLMGPAKITNKYSEADKKLVSYHESGHAITGLELEEGLQVQKITIIPRRNAGGYVSYVPSEEEARFITKNQLEARIITLLAGRAAEEIFIGNISIGAYNDFEQATNIVRAMITKYGMTDIGITLLEHDLHDNIYATKQYSQETAAKIDAKTNEILNKAYQKAKDILNKRKDDMHLLAQTIQEVEVLDKEGIDYLIKYRSLDEYKNRVLKVEENIDGKINEKEDIQS